MAVLRFFLRAKFGKGLSDLGEVEKWIVSESVPASRRVQNDAVGGAAKCPKRLTVAGDGEDTDETRGALFFWNPFRVCAKLSRYWLRRLYCTPRRAVRYFADRGPRSARSGLRERHPARQSPGQSRRPEPVRRERPDCRTPLSCARSPRRWCRLRPPRAAKKSAGWLRSRCRMARLLRRSREVCRRSRLRPEPCGRSVAGLRLDDRVLVNARS